MHLVAVCTGKTRVVEINGSSVRTAYLKTPVRGPCFIGREGPEGNETAVHPDTVYAIASEHYDYWAQRLGSNVSESGYGYFAENLTIAGLDERELHGTLEPPTRRLCNFSGCRKVRPQRH